MSDFAPVSCSKGGGTAAAAAVQPDDDDDDDFLDEEPNYDFLGLTPEDEDGDDDYDFPDDVYEHDDVRKPARNTDDEPPAFTQYILGTLLVRMVEARDVRPVSENGGPTGAGGIVGSLLKKAGRRPGADNGSSKFSSSYSGAKGGGSFLDDVSPPNPFARLRFLGQTQRTSQIYDTFDPAWPRNEEYYFDVTLPVPNLALNSGGGGGGDKDGEKKSGGAGIGKTRQRGRSRNFSQSPNSDGGTPSMGRLPKCPRPTLSIWLLHSDEKRGGGGGKKNVDPTSSKLGGGKMDKEKNNVPSSTPVFLGMASIDIRGVLTGKTPTIDTWVPLTGDGEYGHDDENNNPVTGEVRIICEYQPTDPPPRAGDTCRLTGFCRPADLFPVPPSQLFLVDRVRAEDVLLSYTSPEGWICTLTVHRHMVICAERHQAALELYHDQILDVADRIAHSPLVGAVSDAVCRRLPEDGLITLGLEATGAAGEVLGRWFDGGFDAVVRDVVFATNWDGKHLPANGSTPTGRRRRSSDEEGGGSSGSGDEDDNDEDAFIRGSMGSKTDVEGPDEVFKRQPLPGMPSCPITGQPMRDPVVAADGHTYERTAIVRWMKTSRTSPLTGNVLPHRELVPNYLLISSLSMRHDTEAMTRAAVTGASPGVGGISPEDDDEDGDVDAARSSPVRIKQKLDEERLSLTPTPPAASRDGAARRSRPTPPRHDETASPLMSEFDDEALAGVDETVAFDEVEEMSLQLSPDGTDITDDNVDDGDTPTAEDRGGDGVRGAASSTDSRSDGVTENVVPSSTDASATSALDVPTSTEHSVDGGPDRHGTDLEDYDDDAEDDDDEDDDGGVEDGSEPEDDSSSSRDTDYLSAALSPPGVGFSQRSEDVDKEI